MHPFRWFRLDFTKKVRFLAEFLVQQCCVAPEEGIGRHFFAAGTLYHADADSALTAGNHDALFIIFQDGTCGYEDHEPVILQGHMDMVCEKDEDCPINMDTDGLDVTHDGNVVFAKGTTLGGDDGIAVAYAMAILASDDIKHPALEVVITTDEETGMDGAIGLDTSILKGSYLLNLDSEEEGTILTSCAGGMTVNGTFAWRKVEREGYPVTIQVSGLKGGHSGTEIDKNRENAVLVLTRLLQEMQAANIAFYLL